MEKKVRTRVNGRYADEPKGEENTEPVQEKPAAVGAPRPRYCRTYARKRLAEAAPQVVDAFLEKAKDGSVQHLKTLLELTGIMKDPVKPKVVKRRGKTLARQLLDEWGE